MSWKEQLLRQICQTREQAIRDWHVVIEESNLQKKLQERIQRQPLGWAAGACAAGFALSRVLFRKKRHKYPKQGVGAFAATAPRANPFWPALSLFLLEVARAVAPIAKDFLVEFLDKRIRGWDWKRFWKK